MPRRKQSSKFALKKLSDQQRAELARIEEDAILHYEATIDELEKALGIAAPRALYRMEGLGAGP